MSTLEMASDSMRSAYSYIMTGTLCAVVGGEDAGRLVIIVKCLGPVYHASSGIRIAEGYWVKTYDALPFTPMMRCRPDEGTRSLSGPFSRSECIFDRNRLRELVEMPIASESAH